MTCFRQFLSLCFLLDFSFGNAAKQEWVPAETRAVDQLRWSALKTHWTPTTPKTSENEHKVCSNTEQVTGSCTVEKWTSYTGNALKPFPFQFVDSSFDRSLSNCFLLLSLNFSRFFLVSFGCPWMISWLKSIKSIHIPQYFVIIDFVRFFKLINRLLSGNIDFIDLSISFPMIDFDRFVTPWQNPFIFLLCFLLSASRRHFVGH